MSEQNEQAGGSPLLDGVLEAMVELNRWKVVMRDERSGLVRYEQDGKVVSFGTTPAGFLEAMLHANDAVSRLNSEFNAPFCVGFPSLIDGGPVEYECTFRLRHHSDGESCGPWVIVANQEGCSYLIPEGNLLRAAINGEPIAQALKPCCSSLALI